MDSRLDVAQLELQVLQSGAFPRIQRLAQFNLNPEVLHGEGHGAGARQEAADHAHFPVRLAFQFLSANIQKRVHLYKVSWCI